MATGAIESPFYAWKSINFLLYYFVGNDFYLTFVKVIRLTRLLEWITRLYTARMDYGKFKNQNRPARGSKTESSTRKSLLFTVLF